ncbi:MAG: hypothetical protein JF887_10685 [Candidatus Dormibacteraeota bacterium]|uniref:Methyltransferase domain-containing protein n=1 Tax=Candidatus Amunia macphersoniae TaxID=3127014 RepID=A0A934NGY3_9BACT|nr:hypothetical protein [Candidatus Dormibacteraeota bacterium]
MTWSRIYAAALLGPLAEQLVDAAGILPGMRVLDVFGGAGVLSRRLATVLGPNGSLVALEEGSAEPLNGGGDAARMLEDELRSARVRAQVTSAPSHQLPFGDGEFDVAVSLLRVTAVVGGTPALAEMQRVAHQAAAIVAGERCPAPEDLLARAWTDVTGDAPAHLRMTDPVELPPRWTATPLADVARFDSAEQLWTALEQFPLTTPDGASATVRRRFSTLLAPFEGADGTLRIPVEMRLLRTPPSSNR